MEEVEELMERVACMLPYIAKKFLEMHATGNPTPIMSGLTDEMVDIFRKHYAMDIYKGGVLRLYLQN
ncbi:unnamed protein product [Brassica rapa]|uniref:Uncharacterized protein n=1 Tax=Brassica campestris TaxID=3711 RepID=A0A3P6BLK4_BRACM|nr:unnamed protein product [Brassica rapa]VDD03336.1 unnamed protein product [Brassica rapa]